MTSQSTAVQLGISASGPVTDRFEVVSSTLGKSSELIIGEGQRGTRARKLHRVKKDMERVAGNIIMEPSVTEIDKLLPWILGGTTSVGGVTECAETIPTRVITIDKVIKVPTFAGCVAQRLVIEGTKGQPLRWTFDVQGTTETVGAAASFPSLSIDTDNFFIYSESALTLGGTAFEPETWRLTIENIMDTERFLNSSTRTAFPLNDRLVTMDVTVPYDSDADAIVDIAEAGIAGSLVITDGTTTYTVSLTNLKSGASPIEVPVRNELKLGVTMQSFADATDDEVKFTKT